jgi:hypothetical protein
LCGTLQGRTAHCRCAINRGSYSQGMSIPNRCAHNSYILYKYPLVGEEPSRVASRNLASPHAQLMPRLLAWLGDGRTPHTFGQKTFPSDPLGFSQIPGHCATQCRVVVIPDMVALAQRRNLGLTRHSPAGAHTPPAPVAYEKRPKISKKTLAEHCSTQSSTGREWMPKGAGNGDP